MGNANVNAFKPPPRKTTLEEVTITVLKYQVDPLLSPLSEKLYVAIPVGAPVSQLKLRIQGATGIPLSLIRLMLCGSALEDSDPVPTDAFEVTRQTTDDAVVFRPRLFLTLKPALEDARPPSVVSEVSEVDEEELRLAAEARAAQEEAERHEAELLAIREARTRELEERLRAEHMRPADFDLSSDLEKIGCAHFIMPLRRAGFADEGAFASLSDDVLQEHGLWIPRKARVRLVALADSIKRRIEVRSRSRPGALREVERAMVLKNGSGAKINTRTVEGLDSNFTTKASVTKAFEAKKREEARAKSAEAEALRLAAEAEAHKDDPRSHDPDTARLIAAIRWRCTEDEFGIPINCYRPEPPRACCSKHLSGMEQRRADFLTSRAEGNLTALTIMLARADTFGRGVCSRAALRNAALYYLKRELYLLPPPAAGGDETRVEGPEAAFEIAGVSADELEQLLSECVVSAEEQRRREAWGSLRERLDCPVGRIPAPLFDARELARRLAIMLRQADEKRYLSIQRPFTHLPYPRK